MKVKAPSAVVRTDWITQVFQLGKQRNDGFGNWLAAVGTDHMPGTGALLSPESPFR